MDKNWQRIRSLGEIKPFIIGKDRCCKNDNSPQSFFLLQTMPVVKDARQFELCQKRVNKFIWDGKRARIKTEYLMDDKQRGGLQLPNVKLYHDAICQTWINDWLKWSNKRLLNLEGFNKCYGWHSYLMYDKLKVDSMFAHHYVRGNLIKVWQKYSNRLDKRRPLWISPPQVIELRMKCNEDKIITYHDV